MTVTFLAWIAVASRVALGGVRFPHPHKHTALAPVPRPRPAAAPGARHSDAEGWRPRVSSGCGR